MTPGATVFLALLPDGDEAQEWAEHELTDAVYEAAKPTFVDRIADAIGDFLNRLLNPDIGSGWSPLLTTIVVAIIIGVIVLAFIIWGRPRSTYRAEPRSATLFGDDDSRTASELRAAAQRSAAAGDWDQAIIERFRAIARSLEERDVLAAPPGMTAQQLPAAAAAPFPEHASALAECARSFDDVRYLRRPGTRPAYESVVRADDEIARARPVRAARVLAAAGTAPV